MTILLDTHALLWWLTDSHRLSDAARLLIADSANVTYVSAASVWEIAIKISLRRLAIAPNVGSWLLPALHANRFTPLPISMAHAASVEHLPHLHADPFDRLLIAQAKLEELWLMTSDAVIQQYDVRVIRCDVEV